MKNRFWRLQYLFLLIVLSFTGLSCDDDNFPPGIEGKWELQKDVNHITGKEEFVGKELIYDFQTDGILSVYSIYYYHDPRMGEYDYEIIIEGGKSKLRIGDLIYEYQIKGKELVIDYSYLGGSTLYLSRFE